MRALKLLVPAVLALCAPQAARAVDAPHDLSQFAGECMACHQLHNALGTALTAQATLSQTCLTCHATNTFAWTTGDQSTLGVSGVHHRWDATAVNGAVGTTLPADAQMAARVLAGRIECATCHNQHAANKAFAMPGSMRTSIPVGTPVARNNPPAGATTQRLTLVSASTAAVAKGYRVRVTGANLLAVSHDGGLSWFRPTVAGGPPWVADAATPAGGPYAVGTDMVLDDPALVIRLSAGAAAGDEWNFYVSFPMMRSNNSAGELCIQCHQERNQRHLDIEGGGDGVKRFSHPVGEVLGANGKLYDRAAVLDTDGSPQGSNTDGNPTNDLVLGVNGVVSCTTCHAAHGADSNSMSIDPH
jgi:hypothetical protein